MRMCLCCLLLSITLLAGCGRGAQRPEATDIRGVMPHLRFAMMRVNDGAAVTADRYRGRPVILYFGYTHCPDICPATLSNLTLALKQVGEPARNARILFVTVDPERDSAPVLKTYVESFAPYTDGLRGSADSLAALARRYRVAYSVSPGDAGKPYAVMHSSAVFFFDGSGRARLVTLSTQNVEALAKDIAAVLDKGGAE